jgi:hypothetical protein
VKPTDLHKLWSAPDNSRLTAKQISVRLPVHVAAKINALCDLFPNKTKTEIIGDLLTAALDDLIEGLPSKRGEELEEHPEFGRIYEEIGQKAQFRELANKHFKALERELGNKNPPELYLGTLTIAER